MAAARARSSLRPWWLVALVALVAAGSARELDPAACAARFDVQRNKIIRTEESRDMGARYLSELDVGARAECLRLCCETDACDVFVYEEKGPGSCYLFKCGPPEDFRCKFTAHGNFSSGVLALSRRLAELQDRERDPTPQAAASSGSAATAPAAAAAPTSSQRPPPAPPAPPPASPPRPHADLLLTPGSGRCSRYQFECRRGGECIAVYNACDGVPQCGDASDEAPELGCPPAPAPAPARPQESLERAGSRESSQSQPAAAAAPAPAGADRERSRWPHRLALAQPQPPPPHRYAAAYEPPEESGSSHIFSHKGGLVQEAESIPPAPAAYPPFEPPWPRRPWPPPPPPQPHHQTSESGGDGGGGRGWDGGGGWGGGGGGGGSYPRLEWGEEARRAWQVPSRAHTAAAAAAAAADPEVLYGGGGAASAGIGTLRDSAKKGPGAVGARGAGGAEPQPSPPAPPPTRIDIPKSKPHHDKMSEQQHVQALRRDEVEGAGGAEARLADGLSEHPPAAMLLLVLGMAMTAALGGALGCRHGAARRRLRRGGGLAHHAAADADYLVNGMYL